jgi:hypothetical protein|tara:strand:- start:296 stop:643 length:348 start_codon:yes stop_codon:yes gene_type:complete
MPIITLQFPFPINDSVQVGDTAYYTNDANGTNLIRLGPITEITRAINQMKVDILPQLVGTVDTALTTSSFILFSKTALVNTSGLKGYYAEAQFKNDSIDYAELFLVGSEIFDSSK